MTCWIVRNLRGNQNVNQSFLFMDSFRNLISREDKQKIYETLSFVGDSAKMEFHEVKVPQQTNGHDWGIHILRHIKTIANNPQVAIQAAYKQDVIDEFKKNTLTREDMKNLMNINERFLTPRKS